MRQRVMPIPGSERTFPAGANVTRRTPMGRLIGVTIVLRPAQDGEMDFVDKLADSMPHRRKHLGREEFEDAYGANQDDIAAIRAFAKQHSLTIKKVSVSARTVDVQGTVGALSRAFAVELVQCRTADTTFRGREGPVYIPTDIAGIVRGVFGLDNRPQVSPRCLELVDGGGGWMQTMLGVRSARDIAQLYSFPRDLDGSGQCVASVEFGGGYRLRDINSYFQQTLGISPPAIAAVPAGTRNSPTWNLESADAEVSLGIQTLGAIAPAAKIRVYFARNSERGFLRAINQAIHDDVNRPSVIKISWGKSESSWTASALRNINDTFRSAATLGITVCCAAGNDGCADGATDGLVHADFPASSTYALACGGTHVHTERGKIVKESVWNSKLGSTGGGVSDFFELPSWQLGFQVPPSPNPSAHEGRGVPDVSAAADPAIGCRVLVNGRQTVLGGTSAAAALWAGLAVLLNQKLGQPVGWLTPLLYQKLGKDSAKGFRDIVTGDNGVYAARTGWDPCTGLGSPNGDALLNILAASPDHSPHTSTRRQHSARTRPG
jgi:kumamolisin